MYPERPQQHRPTRPERRRHLLPWGSDFQFTNAGLWFAQMDQLVAEINGNVAKYGARVRYATLSTYFDELHASAAPLPVNPEPGGASPAGGVRA